MVWVICNSTVLGKGDKTKYGYFTIRKGKNGNKAMDEPPGGICSDSAGTSNFIVEKERFTELNEYKPVIYFPNG